MRAHRQDMRCVLVHAGSFTSALCSMHVYHVANTLLLLVLGVLVLALALALALVTLLIPTIPSSTMRCAPSRISGAQRCLSRRLPHCPTASTLVHYVCVSRAPRLASWSYPSVLKLVNPSLLKPVIPSLLKLVVCVYQGLQLTMYARVHYICVSRAPRCGYAAMTATPFRV